MSESVVDEATAASAGSDSPAGILSGGKGGGGGKSTGTGGKGRGSGGGGGRRMTATGSGWFDIYKRGQGGYTRMGTFFGAGVLILAGGDFIYEQLSVFRDDQAAWSLWMQAGITIGFLVGTFLVTFWVCFVNRKSSDFFIATEGEMKKVNWSTRREVIGSTKVVIVFTLLMSLILFVVDMVFMTFFSWMGVLKEAPSILSALFGGGA